SFHERFRSEASLVSKLNHPHIVRIHALEQTDAGFLIDMEYLESGSLAELLLNHGVTLHASLRIVEQSLDALRVCHEAGVVHRDVKPSNILFDANGILRLT